MKVTQSICVVSFAFTSAVGIGATAAQDASGVESEPLAETANPTGEGSLFERLDPEKTGVDLVIPIEDDHSLARAYHSSSACSGVAIGDFDLDGLTAQIGVRFTFGK